MRVRTAAATAVTLALGVPAAAAAAGVLVDHGHGPDVVHDQRYAEAETQVHAWAKDGQSRVRLMVTGLPAGRTFGAHVHTGHCGSDPLASGGHYQHPGDPTSPLEHREVWLDVTTDAEGRGVAHRTVDWVFAPGTAGSVVIHEAPTNPVTGAAGPRLVCTDVAFGEQPGR